jgi:hypothetical protein
MSFYDQGCFRRQRYMGRRQNASSGGVVQEKLNANV